MEDIFMDSELFFRVSTFVIAVYLFISSTIKTDESQRKKLFVNVVLIILAAMSVYWLRFSGMWLYALGIILSGRLLGFPNGLITGILLAFYTTYYGLNLYPFGIESIMLGLISDSYHLNFLSKVKYPYKDLLMAFLLAVFALLIMSRGMFLGIFFDTITFLMIFIVISTFENKVSLIKAKEKELDNINLTCNSLISLHVINQEIKSDSNLEDTYEVLIKIGCQKLGVNAAGFLGEVEDNFDFYDIKAFEGLDRKYLKKMKVNKGQHILGQIITSKESLIINDIKNSPCQDMNLFTEDGFKSLLAVPILSKEEPIGIIFFLSKKVDFFSNEDIVLIHTISEQAPLLIEKAKIFEKMERNVAGLSTLQRTSNTINSTLDLNEVIDMTVDVIMGTMGVSMAGLFLLEGKDKKLVLASSSGVPMNEEKRKIIYGAKRLAGDTINKGEFLITDNIDKNIREKFDSINLMSVVSIPLKVRGRIIGAITAAQIGFKRNFKEADRKFLETLANQIAIAIDNASMYKQMEELATRDGLTKLYNHSYFQESLSQEIDKAQRYERDLSLIIMDIDNFKDFNDTYGHQVGDEVLKNLARLLEDQARNSDIVARYGGEEFVIILPETNKEGAFVMGQRINKEVRNMVVRYDELNLKVTISIGAASFSSEMSQKDLISAADNALYKAKAEGKDRTCISS
ncbi:sensor domain-containing diguanylate cyclase [Halonatronum saccharophilum]|uniref:sensor domain-containing diguanylate cyclase n=1 Tax=Halonatronum saccharophilum TaxID=150060 RepID=UPI000482076F|nr:diguanylate cyclase [Halonatronum saccharophilum]